MKAEDYDNYRTQVKSFEFYKSNQPAAFKKTLRDRLD